MLVPATSGSAGRDARHSAYVFFFVNMCQMVVASFLMTATRAMLEPRRRLIRLNHSRSRASLRNTWRVICANNHRAVALPALVILPGRLVSPLSRQPGVSPQ